MGGVGLEVGVGVELGGGDSCVDEGNAAVAVVAEPIGVPGCDVVDSHLEVDPGDHHELALGWRQEVLAVDYEVVEGLEGEIEGKGAGGLGEGEGDLAHPVECLSLVLLQGGEGNVDGVGDVAAVDVAESLDGPLLGEGGVALVVVDGVVDVELQIVLHFGQADHVCGHAGVFLQLLNCEIVFLNLVLPVGVHGLQVLVEELEEGVGKGCAEGEDIREVLVFVAINPVLMVPVPPALQQQVSCG